MHAFLVRRAAAAADPDAAADADPGTDGHHHGEMPPSVRHPTPVQATAEPRVELAELKWLAKLPDPVRPDPSLLPWGSTLAATQILAPM